jgi:hypothetical protein
LGNNIPDVEQKLDARIWCAQILADSGGLISPASGVDEVNG